MLYSSTEVVSLLDKLIKIILPEEVQLTNGELSCGGFWHHETLCSRKDTRAIHNHPD